MPEWNISKFKGNCALFYLLYSPLFSPKHNKFVTKRNPWSLIKQPNPGSTSGYCNWALQLLSLFHWLPIAQLSQQKGTHGRTSSVAVGLCLCLVCSVRRLILKHSAWCSVMACSPQLEKICMQPWRPSAAKNEQRFLKKTLKNILIPVSRHLHVLTISF